MEGALNTNIENEAEVIEITPMVDTENMVEGEIVFEQNDPLAISEVNPELGELSQINLENAVEVVNSNPEKAERLTNNFAKIKAIANILGDAAALGIGATVLNSNMDANEHLIFNTTSIVAMLATTASVFKLAWDMSGLSTSEKKKVAQPLAV